MEQPAESCKGSGSCRLLGEEPQSFWLWCLLSHRSAGAKNCELVRIKEAAVMTGCWAWGGCSQQKGSCLWMQSAEELNSVTVTHLFQRWTNVASLQSSGDNHPLPSHFPRWLSHKCVSEPPWIFLSQAQNQTHDPSVLPEVRVFPSKLYFSLLRNSVWEELRDYFSPFVQSSRASREGQHCVPSGLCHVQALLVSPRCTHSTGSSQKNWIYCLCTNRQPKKSQSLFQRDIPVWEIPQPQVSKQCPQNLKKPEP